MGAAKRTQSHVIKQHQKQHKIGGKVVKGIKINGSVGKGAVPRGEDQKTDVTTHPARPMNIMYKPLMKDWRELV